MQENTQPSQQTDTSRRVFIVLTPKEDGGLQALERHVEEEGRGEADPQGPEVLLGRGPAAAPGEDVCANVSPGGGLGWAASLWVNPCPQIPLPA